MNILIKERNLKHYKTVFNLENLSSKPFQLKCIFFLKKEGGNNNDDKLFQEKNALQKFN